MPGAQGQCWSETATLVMNKSGEDDYFGSSTSVDGDTAIVGAPGDDNANGGNAGSVLLLRARPGWSRQLGLGDQEGRPERRRRGQPRLLGFDLWGYRRGRGRLLELSGLGGRVCVRTRLRGTRRLGTGRCPDSIGRGVARLLRSLGRARRRHDRRGCTMGRRQLARHCNTTRAARTSSNATRVAPGLGERSTKLLPSVEGHFVGVGVAIQADTIVIAGSGSDGITWATGAAYVFERNLGGPDAWGQRTTLYASDGNSGDSFGIRCPGR